MSCFIPKDELMIIKSIDLYTYFKTIKPDEFLILCKVFKIYDFL